MDGGGLLQVVGGQDVVVVHENDQGAGGLRDAPQSGRGQADLVLANMPGSSVPGDVECLSDSGVAGVVDEDQFPLVS